MHDQYGDLEISETANQPLECWENIDGEFEIHIEHPEFTALCPRSGYPDSGKIVIDYIPANFLCELKSIKLFVNGFRNQRISHERVVNQIADRFFHDVQPKSLRVIGDFMRRGGVKTVITVTRGHPCHFARYIHEVL